MAWRGWSGVGVNGGSWLADSRRGLVNGGLNVGVIRVIRVFVYRLVVVDLKLPYRDGE